MIRNPENIFSGIVQRFWGETLGYGTTTQRLQPMRPDICLVCQIDTIKMIRLHQVILLTLDGKGILWQSPEALDM